MKRHQKTVSCECGCGGSGQRNKMRVVRMTDGAARRVGHALYRNVRSYRVLPACEKLFKRELHAKERCRVMLLMLAELPLWKRVAKLPSLWNLRRAMLSRRLGEKQARRQAWGFVWLAVGATAQKAAA